MQKQPAKYETVCWINSDKGIISFHFIEGFEQKEFPSRKDMISFCYQAINDGYKIQ